MGYFSNGTEGEIYMAAYCHRCLNWKEDKNGEGCPVMDLHFMHSYDQDKPGNEQIKAVLDLMIPPAPAPEWNAQCAMFTPAGMKPDRTYTPPTPEAYVLLANARYHLDEAVRAAADVADEQLEGVQAHYAPDHECTDACKYVSMSVWLNSCMAEQESARITEFLDKHAKAQPV